MISFTAEYAEESRRLFDLASLLAYHVSGNAVNTSVPMSTGTHNLTVQSWDRAGGIHKRSLIVNVQSQSVVINTPTPNAISSSPVTVQATAGGKSTVNAMKVYVDGTLKYQVSGSTVNNSFSMATGKHSVTVTSVDQDGATQSSVVSMQVQSPSVTIASPLANSTLYSPVTILASAQGPSAVRSMSLSANSTLIYQVTGTGISAPITISPGAQTLKVQATDASGQIFSKQINMNIKPVVVSVSAPAPNASVSSPVAFKTSVPSASLVYAIQIYVDGVCVYTGNGKIINTSLPIHSGTHAIQVEAWDTGYGTWTESFKISVH